MTGYEIVLVNGGTSTGSIYKILPIFEPCIDFVVVSAVSGMQNESPDGIVLYVTNSVIADSLSYSEGKILMNGGWDLKDISVTSETPTSTPIGYSLQKIGAGCDKYSRRI